MHIHFTTMKSFYSIALMLMFAMGIHAQSSYIPRALSHSTDANGTRVFHSVVTVYSLACTAAEYRRDVMFDITGRMHSATGGLTSGLYIIDGKKVLVK